MINTKDDICIIGFDDRQAAFSEFERLTQLANGTIYAGKTLDIPEEVAKECVKEMSLSTGIFYVNYIKIEALKRIEEKRDASHNILITQPMLNTAKESIQSAVAKEDGSFYDYIIIFKK